MQGNLWDTTKAHFREDLKAIELSQASLNKLSRELTVSRNSIRSLESSKSMIEMGLDLEQDIRTHSSRAEATLSKLRELVPHADPVRRGQVDRFHDQLAQYKRDLNRSWVVVKSEIDRRQLMAPSSTRSLSDPNSQPAMLLTERSSLVHSIGMVDATLENAVAAGNMIRDQNRTMSSVSTKVGSLLARVPLVNGLLSRINNRQFQETLILGLVIGVCVSIWIWTRLLR